MRYEVQRSEDCKFDFVAFAVNDGDLKARDVGEIYVTVFSGPLAEERANEYANWKNNGRA